MAQFITKLIWPLLVLMCVIMITLVSPAPAFAQRFEPEQRARLQNRITEGAILNSTVVNEILSLSKCPAGQVAVEDETNLRTGVDARYDEHRDRSRYRYPTRYGYNQDFELSNTNRVRAEARTNARRQLTCVAPHLLSAPSP